MPHPTVTGIMRNNHEKFNSILTAQHNSRENIKYIEIWTNLSNP
jgi:hypothetical protein